MIRFIRLYHEIIVDLFILLVIEALLLSSFRPDLLLLQTTLTGGDTPSFAHPADHLRKILLPSGNPLGWDPGNFGGYPPFQYYNLLPFMLIVGLSYLIPFDIAFKLVTVFGILMLPIAVYAVFRLMRYQYPLPAIAAATSLSFLYNGGNSMWGGNILSTLAGEFCFSIGLALAIAFWGGLWRGIETGKGAAVNALLLAATGLSHPIPFLYATLAGLFFLLRPTNILRTVGYMTRVYAGGAMIMGFWLIPLLAKMEYSTRINWVWGDLPFLDVFPKILLPFFILAVVNVLVYIFIPRWRDHRTAFFFFAGFVNVIAFLNATAAGLPEIRFVPIVQLVVPFLAVDLLRIGIERIKGRSILALAMLITLVTWATWGPSNVQSWVQWNYTGFEGKYSWDIYRRLNEFLRGTPNDPRVFYEHADEHNRFGSIRAFESLPYFSGRSTLEGALLQTAVSSPFIYYIQSETSRQATNVIPGYSYSRFNLVRGTKHLEMYNVSHVIASTDSVKSGFDAHPSYSRVFERSPYVIYRLKTNRDHYVVVPGFAPVLLQTADWKQDFHRWFEEESLFEVPLVPANRVPREEVKRFEGPVADPLAAPRVPISGNCQIDEKISDETIEFVTSCPGKPHLIRISYFPNWKVEGAKHVYLTTPAFMLVFPEQAHVKLTYGRTASDFLGGFLTIVGIISISGAGRFIRTGARRFIPGQILQPLSAFIPMSGKFLERSNTMFKRWIPYLAAAIIGLALVAGIWNYYIQSSSQRLYEDGSKLFQENKYPEARRLFEKVRSRKEYDQVKVSATFFIGQTYLRENNYEKALEFFQESVRLYPESVWVQESRYHVGLCLEKLGRIREAREMYNSIIKEDPGNRWANFSKERIQGLGKVTPQQTYEQAWKLFDEKKYPEARRMFEQLRNLPGSDPIKVTGTFFVGQTYFRENNYAKAMEFFQEVVRLHPTSTWYLESRYHTGFCLERLGRIEEARQMYNSVIQQDPKNRWAGFSNERLQVLSKNLNK